MTNPVLNSDPTEAITCTICLDGFDPKIDKILRLSCEHFFHLNCIASWFIDQNSCPLCRMEVTDIYKIEAAIAKALAARITNLFTQGPFEGDLQDEVFGYFEQGIEIGWDYFMVVGALSGVVSRMRISPDFEQFAELIPRLLIHPDAVRAAVQKIVESLVKKDLKGVGLFLKFLSSYELCSEHQLLDILCDLLIDIESRASNPKIFFKHLLIGLVTLKEEWLLYMVIRAMAALEEDMTHVFTAALCAMPIDQNGGRMSDILVTYLEYRDYCCANT